MPYHVLLHHETGMVMPLFPTNRGYTHWEPFDDAAIVELGGVEALGGLVPRLFYNRTGAAQARSKWAEGVHTRCFGTYGGSGVEVRAPSRARSPEDLRILPVELQYVVETEEEEEEETIDG